MNDADLDQLLKSAGTPLAPPSGFQRDVWRRIESTEISGWKARLRQTIEHGLGCLALPRMAIATCTAVALVGAWIGTNTATPEPLHQASYLHSISPFAHSNHR